jgi:hypothetical protein
MCVSRCILLGLAACLLSCKPVEKAEPLTVYRIGDPAPAGHLTYTVFEKQWHTQLGGGPAPRVPQNRFYLLRVKVANNGSEEAIVPRAELIDDSGATFPEASDGEGVSDWIGYIRQIRPAETTQGYVLFDVLPKHYKLRVSAEDGKRNAFVDIPLTFDSDAPDLSAPIDPSTIPAKK